MVVMMKDHIPGVPVGALGWVEYKCRCPECRAGYRALGETARERRRNGPTPSWVHGTWNGYTNYGCDCSQCLAASSARNDYARAHRMVVKQNLLAEAGAHGSAKADD